MKPRAFLKTFMLFLLTLCIPLVVFFAATSIFTHQQLRELSISRNTRELQQIETSMEMILNQITQFSLSYDLNTLSQNAPQAHTAGLIWRSFRKPR